MSLNDIALLSAATFAAGFLRGVTGFGFGLAAVPLYSLVVPPLYAVVVTEMLQIAAAPFDIYNHRKHIDRKALLTLCVGALFGAPIGAYLATSLPADILRLVLACMVLVGLSALIAKMSIRDGTAPALVSGWLAGLLAGLAAMPGPPAVAYFLGRGVNKSTARASLLLFFSFSAALALGFVALSSDVLAWSMLGTAAASYPALLVGTWAGSLLFDRLGDGHYRIAGMAVMFVSALLAGGKGLAGLL